ncbi:hypothetical protein Pint_23362 [Pistacia integerrima]|uniref:Uncharacterized protein n=1 Tax=Pistacia integerrima TaxID=434235 RepID=A0ACC0YIQ7_9ROSI|nr:hypothetical protein Pint_23362 [Pistacia integerrima]
MASSNSTPASSFVIPNITSLVSVKLDGTNYLNWITQFTHVLRSHDLLGIVDGSEICPNQYLVDSTGKSTSDLNPDYLVWQKKDQFILAWLNSALSEKIMSTVYGLTTSKMLTAAGKPVDEEDLISYVIGGLNSTYNPFITSLNFATRDKSISFDDFQTKLLNYEQLLDSQTKTLPSEGTQFAFFTNKPKVPYGKKPKYFNQQTKPSTYSRPTINSNSGHNSPKTPSSGGLFPSNKFPPCQIYGKPNHQALDCYHRMDFTYQGRHPLAQLTAMAIHTHVTQEVDQPWYLDSGANNYITSELGNLTLQQQPYQGNDKVTVGNGGGLVITNTGSSMLLNSKNKFLLHNILHCPHASSNLLSIQKFCSDNSCYFVLTASHFFVKDLQTRKILMQGQSEGGLYPTYLKQMKLNSSKSKTAHISSFTALQGV